MVNPQNLSDLGIVRLGRGLSIVTPYFLVYGTLRVDQPNYKSLRLAEFSFHVGTYRLPGFNLYGQEGQNSFPTAIHTGDEKDTIVVDLFETSSVAYSRTDKEAVQNVLSMYELHFQMDRLEWIWYKNGYGAMIIPIQNKHQEILLCKFYESPTNFNSRMSVNKTGDWLNTGKEYEILKIVQPCQNKAAQDALQE